MPNDIGLLNTIADLYDAGGEYLNDLDALNAIAVATGGAGGAGGVVQALTQIYTAIGGGETPGTNTLTLINQISGHYGGSEGAENVADALTAWAGVDVSSGPTLNAIYILCDNENVYRTNQDLTDDWTLLATVPVAASGNDDLIVTPGETFIIFANMSADMRVYNGVSWSTNVDNVRSMAIDTVNEQIFYSVNGEIRVVGYDLVGDVQWRSADTLPTGFGLDLVNGHAYWLEYIQDDYVRINTDLTEYTRTAMGFEFGDFNQTCRVDPEHGYIYFIEENTSGADHVYRLTIATNAIEELPTGNFSVSNQAFAPLRVEDAVAVAQLGSEGTLAIISPTTLLPLRSKVAPANIVAIFCSFTEASE